MRVVTFYSVSWARHLIDSDATVALHEAELRRIMASVERDLRATQPFQPAARR